MSRPTEQVRQTRARDGTQLTYWFRRCETRPAPLLLLLHGAASNHTRWSELLTLGRLTESWDVLTPDLRGSGASRVHHRVGFDLWCRDLCTQLDVEGFSAATVVGHSLGAQIALQLAARTPQRIEALVLIDPVIPGALRGSRRWLARARPLLALAALLVRGVGHLGWRQRKFAQLDLRISDAEVRHLLQSTDGRAQLVKEYSSLRSILQHEPLSVYLDQSVATFTPLPPPEELALQVLALLASGTSFASPEIQREQIARFPNVEIASIDASHWPITEKPEEVRQVVERWLSARRSEAQALHD